MGGRAGWARTTVFKGKNTQAHRVAGLLQTGEDPGDLEIDQQPLGKTWWQTALKTAPTRFIQIGLLLSLQIRRKARFSN